MTKVLKATMLYINERFAVHMCQGFIPTFMPFKLLMCSCNVQQLNFEQYTNNNSVH